MSTDAILIIISSIIIISFILDFFSFKTKIPHLVFLILAGIIARNIMDKFGWHIPYLNFILAPLGTLGLIMIVLEAGLDLEINRTKLAVIRNSFISAFSSLVITLFLIAILYKVLFGSEVRLCLINALPLAVMSSAIAIPGVSYLNDSRKEFIIYESSFSDILGIIVFNFLIINTSFGLKAYFYFGFEITGTIIISFVLSLGLAYLLEKIDHKIKYLPVFCVLLLIYAMAKTFHFSPLILVLVFGILANNISLFAYGKTASFFDFGHLREEMNQFGGIVRESTFLIKTFFFLLLGYSTNIKDFTDINALTIAMPVLAFIYLGRWLPLKLLAGNTAHALSYIAPRGLITVLLYLSIPGGLIIKDIPFTSMVIIILATSLILAWGVMKPANPEMNTPPEETS